LNIIGAHGAGDGATDIQAASMTSSERTSSGSPRKMMRLTVSLAISAPWGCPCGFSV
jgi:hypothetical protein